MYFIGFFRSRDIGSTVDHHPVLRPSRSGATENATVVGESCADLEQRGVKLPGARGCMCWTEPRRSMAVKKRGPVIAGPPHEENRRSRCTPECGCWQREHAASEPCCAPQKRSADPAPFCARPGRCLAPLRTSRRQTRCHRSSRRTTSGFPGVVRSAPATSAGQASKNCSLTTDFAMP